MKTFKEFFTLGVSKPSKMNVQKYLDDLGSARRLLSIPDIIKKIEDYFKTIKNLKIDRSARKVLSFNFFIALDFNLPGISFRSSILSLSLLRGFIFFKILEVRVLRRSKG